MSAVGKTCARCKFQLNLDMFSSRAGRSSFSAICKTCVAEQHHERYLANIEDARAKSKAYNADPANRNRINEQRRTEYHRDHELTRQRENKKRLNCSSKSKQKTKAYADAYRVKNPDKLSAYQREYHRKSKSDLADTFVKKALTHRSLLLSSQLPQALIELKRQQLLLLREINEQR